MSLIFLKDTLNSATHPSILQKAGKVQEMRVILTPDLITDDEYSIMRSLCESLGVSPTNYGISIFDRSEIKGLHHVFLSYPSVGLGENNQLGLMIGCDDQQSNHRSAFVPIYWKADENHTPAEPSGDYYLGQSGKIKCSLSPIQNPQDASKMNFYITFKIKSDYFNVNFKIIPKTSPEQVQTAWDLGMFEQVCRSFYKPAASLSGKKGIFKELFEYDQFPGEGIFLLLANGKKQESEKYAPTSRWTVLNTSHPDFLVTSTTGESVELKEIGTLFCPNSCLATKEVLAGINPKVFFLHVYAPHNTGKLDWIPEHSGSSVVDFLSPRVQQLFKPLILEGLEKVVKPLSDRMSNSNRSNPQPQLIGVASRSSFDEDDETEEDIHF